MAASAVTSLNTRQMIEDAVGPHESGFRGFQDRLFARLFSGLVYAQIWEDPEVDMEAMALGPDHHIVTIASGGCNALSYLTARPAQITAVDLNRAHVALVKLKIAGAQHLPDWQSFYRFFGAADDPENVTAYHEHLARHLDEPTRVYWEKRSWGKPRINGFARNIYRRGLLGKFIGASHLAAKIYGLNLQGFLDCRDLGEQRAYFNSQISPVFSRPMLNALIKSPMALFGLGIPPQQYEALSDGGSMRDVLQERLRKLTCDHPLSENYFAWQAFGRGYAPDGAGPLPPYLQRPHFDLLRREARRLTVQQANMTDVLAGMAPGSVDRVVLLDAQDWMSDAQLNALWSAITTAAAPNARVIFRTAGRATILPGRVAPEMLGQWTYLEALSARLHAKDRSSIYGGFHVYERQA